MDESPAHIFEFGNFCVDAAKRLLLTRDNQPVPLMPKAFDTLLYLVEHSGKVIEKEELISAIWADTNVEENNLTQNISVLRRVLGERHGENRFIATVPGHGYKFVAEVRKVGPAEKSVPPVAARGAESSFKLDGIRKFTFTISHFKGKKRRPETEDETADNWAFGALCFNRVHHSCSRLGRILFMAWKHEIR